MEVIVLKDYQQISQRAFEEYQKILDAKKDAVLGLATGSSPVGLYQLLVKEHQKKGRDYSKVTTYNLDEYVGLGKYHSQSYYTFMNENLFSGIEIPGENTHLPDGNCDDLNQACKDYDDALDKVSVDVQLLGIGGNGHIGFNEPGTPFTSTTHIVTLKEKTRKDNARFFDPLGEQVPTQAITMGISTIMKAKKVILLASGSNKVDAIYGLVKGPVSEDCPASILQNHPDCLVIVDEAAAAKL